MTSPNVSIEDAPINNFHQLLTLRSGGGSFVDGYVLSIIGVAMVQMSAGLNLTSFWQGMIAASALIGIFFGGFFGGWLTDRFGRKRVFFVGPTLFILASIAQFWVESAMVLFLLRFAIGIAVGIEYPVATSLLVEFLPKKNRGPRLATLTVLWFAGAACAYMVGEAILRHGGDDAWRLVLASASVIGALLFAIRIGTPESPRWLISKGRSAEAEQVIKRVYGRDFSLKNLPEEPKTRKLSFFSLLHSGYGKRMLFVTMFWTCSVIPVFAVYAFAPKVLGALNLKGDWAAIGSVAITCLFVVGCIIGTRLLNTIGRRTTLLHHAAAQLLLVGAGVAGPGRFQQRQRDADPRPVRRLRLVYRWRPGVAAGVPQRTVPYRNPCRCRWRGHLDVAGRCCGRHLAGAHRPR